MKLSVHIPTYRRPDAINQCLAHLAAQSCAHPFEIIVGLDGPASATPDPVVPDSIQANTKLLRLDRLGLIGVRKAMLEETQAEIVLWLNDDAYAHRGLLDAHIAMHDARSDCVVGGVARWKPIDQPDLFDLLIQQTDLVFFHQPMQGEPSLVDYRNCFGLNMSFPRALAVQAGGIPDMTESYGYDDIELVHRLHHAGADIWHAPDAIVTHDHRYRPEDVHRREYLLGRAAWHYAKFNPEFANDLFGREITTEAELGYIKEALMRGRRDAERIERSFLELGKRTPELASLDLIAEHWILLKRYLWRWGVLDAACGNAPRWSKLSELSATLH